MNVPDCPGCRERDAIIAQLLAKIAVLESRVAELEQRVAELTAQLNTNSSNSSLPPSADPPSAPKSPAKRPTGRKPGGQPGHRGHARRRLPPDQIVIHAPTHCQRCQTELPSAPSAPDPSAPWHQVIELPRRPATVTEHQAQARTCPHCGHVSRGRIPPEILAHGFGPNLTATIAFLSGACHGSKRIILQILQSLFGIPLSLGSVANAEQEVSAALQPPCAQLEQAIRRAEVKNADETGWAQRGKLCWLWLAVTAHAALFKVCGGRGRQALAELLGSRVHGVVVTDRWGAYRVIDIGMRQLCWAHLKRDFQKGLDRGGPAAAVGQAGLDAEQTVFALWRDFKTGVLDRPGLQAALVPVVRDLRMALEAGLSCPNEKTARFCRNMLAVYPALWTFALREAVEPTNNLAERTLRPAVIWRKISFGNHSPAGCRFAERILTTVHTLRLQDRDVVAYLQEVVAAHRAGRSAPALAPAGA